MSQSTICKLLQLFGVPENLTVLLYTILQVVYNVGSIPSQFRTLTMSIVDLVLNSGISDDAKRAQLIAVVKVPIIQSPEVQTQKPVEVVECKASKPIKINKPTFASIADMPKNQSPTSSPKSWADEQPDEEQLPVVACNAKVEQKVEQKVAEYTPPKREIVAAYSIGTQKETDGSTTAIISPIESDLHPRGIHAQREGSIPVENTDFMTSSWFDIFFTDAGIVVNSNQNKWLVLDNRCSKGGDPVFFRSQRDTFLKALCKFFGASDARFRRPSAENNHKSFPDFSNVVLELVETLFQKQSKGEKAIMEDLVTVPLYKRPKIPKQSE